MSENGTKRPWLAAVLAVVYPGLGHLYLGLWVRALLWSATAALTATVFVSDEAVALVRDGGLSAAVTALAGETVFMLTAVTVMAAVDAYWHATAGVASHERDAGPTCPECGKDVDEDLAFCQWCTAEFGDAAP